MMWIQIILVATAIILFLFFIRSSHSVKTQAFKRIGFVIFLALNLDAVLRPDDTTWLAHKLGVGRGADLVLYLLVVAFSFFTVNTFLRFRNLERRFTDLARAIALRDAQLPPEVVPPAPGRLARDDVPEPTPASDGEAGPASEPGSQSVAQSTLSGGSAR